MRLHCTFATNSKDIGEAGRIVNTLLQLMEEYDAPGILVATTNIETSLDHALFRRFDDAFSVPLPGLAQIDQLLRFTLSAVKLSPSIPWPEIVELLHRARQRMSSRLRRAPQKLRFSEAIGLSRKSTCGSQSAKCATRIPIAVANHALTAIRFLTFPLSKGIRASHVFMVEGKTSRKQKRTDVAAPAISATLRGNATNITREWQNRRRTPRGKPAGTARGNPSAAGSRSFP